jgi:hypothetical protein
VKLNKDVAKQLEDRVFERIEKMFANSDKYNSLYLSFAKIAARTTVQVLQEYERMSDEETHQE